MKVANIFHAGDGNLHPLVLYNANNPEEALNAERAGAEILELCVKVGGCLTGEHGVGIEKRDLMTVQFSPTDLAVQMRIKSVFDPHWLLNAAKVFPLEIECSAHAAEQAAVKGRTQGERTLAPRCQLGTAVDDRQVRGAQAARSKSSVTARCAAWAARRSRVL